MASPAPTSPVRDSIMAANEQFIAAFTRGDAAGVTACYTADAQLLPAHSDVIQGYEAIEGFWRGAMDMGITGVRLDTVEAEGSGESAYEVGRYTLTAQGGQVADRGKYVVIWRRDSGQWRLHRDIWTSSMPAPGAA